MKRYLFIIGIVPLILLFLLDYLESHNVSVFPIYFILLYAFGVIINVCFVVFDKIKPSGKKIYTNYLMILIYLVIWYLSGFRWGSF